MPQRLIRQWGAILLITGAVNVLHAQEKVVIQPKATVSWKEMLSKKAINAEAQKYIHEPLPGPGPRDIGTGNPPPKNRDIHEEQYHNDIPRHERSITTSTPAINFQALSDNNTTIPPDTHGAVDSNYVMIQRRGETDPGSWIIAREQYR